MRSPKPQLKTDFGDFDPGSISVDNGNIFYLPCTYDDASVVLLPVPWEATVSYRAGTAGGPEALRQASLQLDLYDEDLGDVWRYGIYMPQQPADICKAGVSAREKAASIIAALGRGEDPAGFAGQYAELREQFDWLYGRIEAETLHAIRAGKIAGLAGGDHSVTLGALRAYASQYDRFGILHIDAHADLRNCYEGFAYSHASIMYNALALSQVERIVQVGIRDFCKEEAHAAADSAGRIRMYSDAALKSAAFQGKTWDSLCADIISALPERVYVSFDIDGLDPSLCPRTGTPVPGGLSFAEAVFLLKKLAQSGRKIIGFDLVEVAGTEAENEWDGIIGARLLYKLCGYSIVSCRD